MSSQIVASRISTRKSSNEVSQLLSFLEKVIDSDSCRHLSHFLAKEEKIKGNSCYSEFMEGFKSDIQNGNIKNLDSLKNQLLAFFQETLQMNFQNKELEMFSKDLTSMIQKTNISSNLDRNETLKEKPNGKKYKEDGPETLKQSKSSSKPSNKKKVISKEKNNKKSLSLQKDTSVKIRKKPLISCPFLEAQAQEAKEIEAKASLFCDLSSLSKENTVKARIFLFATIIFLKFLEFLKENCSELIKEEEPGKEIQNHHEEPEKKIFSFEINIETIENITKICDFFKTFKQNILPDSKETNKQKK